jgi:chromatin remodeling complex protein RSC6
MDIISSQSILQLDEDDDEVFDLAQVYNTRLVEREPSSTPPSWREPSSTPRPRRQPLNRQPSGFITPTLISDQLAAFLGKSAGTRMSRVDVSKEINRYIREKGLASIVNGRNINPDEKLRNLLDITSEFELTYFNLQSCMRRHFIR